MKELTGYLQHIGFAGTPRADLATLRAVVLGHTLSIPFENLDALTGRRVSLDPDDVQRKLLLQRRGGWCFEQNLLLGEALRALGFEAVDLAGRVVWGRAADALAARTHRLLKVRIEGRDYIVDAGFGGQTLTGVLDLHSEEAQSTPHEPFRLRRLGDEFLMESQLAGEWRPMFRFDLHPQQPIDFEAANFQLVHDPASHFTQGLRVSRVTPEGRHVLGGFDLAFHALGGGTRRETLPDTAAVLHSLREVFGIDTSGLPDLAACLDSLR
ncbi:MAG: arylamine N-acetyltransferase [Steroidobacteraceae bacterium]